MESMKVFISDGEQFCADEAGWFRITISHQRSYLVEGLERVFLAAKRCHALPASGARQDCQDAEVYLRDELDDK